MEGMTLGAGAVQSFASQALLPAALRSQRAQEIAGPGSMRAWHSELPTYRFKLRRVPEKRLYSADCSFDSSHNRHAIRLMLLFVYSSLRLAVGIRGVVHNHESVKPSHRSLVLADLTIVPHLPAAVLQKNGTHGSING